MSKRTLLIFAVLCAAILVGCSKTENNNTVASNSNKSTTTATTTTTTSSSTTTSSGEKIGVPECDEFIAKYEACTSKVPEIVRSQYQSAVERWRSEWKKMAADPATKAKLADACKQAAEQQAAAWKMYGCTK